jgi:hypothetical protein
MKSVEDFMFGTSAFFSALIFAFADVGFATAVLFKTLFALIQRALPAPSGNGEKGR